MERLDVTQNFSFALVCLFALLMRLGATVNKARETNSTYKLTAWKVFYQAAASFGIGFLAVGFLVETKMGTGWKMGALFVVSFSSTVVVDALLLIKPEMILKEFAAWVSIKLGNSAPAPPPMPPEQGYPPDYSQPNPQQDEASEPTEPPA